MTDATKQNVRPSQQVLYLITKEQQILMYFANIFGILRLCKPENECLLLKFHNEL